LIDTLYLTAVKTKLFKKLPELELPDAFNLKKMKAIIEKIPSSRLKTIVYRRLETLGLNHF
jgi:hypothetical protein